MRTDPAERARRLSSVLQAADAADPMTQICGAATAVLGVSGVSLMLMNGGPPSPLAWSGPLSRRLEELQQTLGEGPCVDAHENGRPAGEPWLADPSHSRWIAFTTAALDLDVAAIFSFPLRMGGIRLGALTANRMVAGDLSDEQHEDALSVSALTTAAILDGQATTRAKSLSRDLEPLMTSSVVLHQATGMVSVQLGVGVAEALVRLRAYAFSADRPLAEVATDVVARRLRLD